jgi:hypothetical protein
MADNVISLNSSKLLSAEELERRKVYEQAAREAWGDRPPPHPNDVSLITDANLLWHAKEQLFVCGRLLEQKLINNSPKLFEAETELKKAMASGDLVAIREKLQAYVEAMFAFEPNPDGPMNPALAKKRP